MRRERELLPDPFSIMSGDDDKTFEDLQQHPWCIEDSIDSELTPGGCIIGREYYDFVPCAAAPTLGIDMVWSDPQYFDILAGYDVELVYTVVPEAAEEDSSSDDNSGN